jgi:hypothetical protein
MSIQSWVTKSGRGSLSNQFVIQDDDRYAFWQVVADYVEDVHTVEPGTKPTYDRFSYGAPRRR